MLRWRLLLGTLIIAVLVVLCWLDDRSARPGLWLVPVAIFFTVLATAEVLDLARAGGQRPLGWAVHLGNLLLVLPQIYWQAATSPEGHRGDMAGLWPPLALAIGLVLVLVGEMARYQRPGGVMGNIAAAVLALVYVGLMLNFAVRLRMVWGIAALASWIIVVKMSDTGAYVVGRIAGRHRLAPALSPGKTVEGAVGALVVACLTSWAVFRWLVPHLDATRTASPPWWGWIVFGLALGLVGMAGDLAESLLKRDVGRKDSSRWMPGFGGMLDILDSLLVTAPVAWFCWGLGLVG